MASMERIGYPPLVAHLQQRAPYYNALYAGHELKHGPIDKEALQQWIVQVVEPVIEEVEKQGKANLQRVFESLFSETLSLLGSGPGTAYQSEYRAAWLLCKQIPLLVSTSPLRIVKALNSALLSIRTFQPAKVVQWITIMEKTVTHCSSVEEFLHCGRVAAWFCGLSHLKDKCGQVFPLLPAALQNKLREAGPLPIMVEESFTDFWTGATPQFVGQAGGFTGFGGGFIAPPLLAGHDDYILATDKANSYILFADAFGNVLLPHPSLEAGDIVRQAGNQSIKNFKKLHGTEAVKFNDISSSVLNDSTLFFTRHSSHYIYIYGWHRNKS